MPTPAQIETDKNLLQILSNQAENPPGNDPVLASLYAAVLGITGRNSIMTTTLENVKGRRPDVTNTHLVNLIPRALQLMKLKENNLSLIPTLTTPEQWETELSQVLTDQSSRKMLEDLLVTKSTTTTVYQRFAGPKALITHLYDGMAVSVADLGCGGNYALRGMELREPFKEIVDETPCQVITQLLSQPVNLEKGLAIDKENPDDAEVRNWRLACRYPRELNEIPGIVAFEDRLRRESQKVQFLQADLVSFTWLPEGVVDVALLSTILYQLKPDEQVTLLKQARSLLKPGGILIVQDFAAKDPESSTTLRFDESWSGSQFGYRTLLACKETDWTFREALQWMGGRCTTTKAGEDFNEIFTNIPPYPRIRQMPDPYSRAFSAAWAHSTS